MNGIQYDSSSSLVTYFYKMQHAITLCDYYTFELHEWYRYHTSDIFYGYASTQDKYSKSTRSTLPSAHRREYVDSLNGRMLNRS